LYAEERLVLLLQNQSASPLYAGHAPTEGEPAIHEAIDTLRRTQPLPPIRCLSSGMVAAAEAHVNDTGPYGVVGHASRDGSSLFERLKKHGQWKDVCGENISYGQRRPSDVICQWLIDDGVPCRSHRFTLLDKSYTAVGIACGRHRTYGTMCVLDLAGGWCPKHTALSKPLSATVYRRLTKTAHNILQSLPDGLAHIAKQVETSLLEGNMVKLEYAPGSIQVTHMTPGGTDLGISMSRWSDQCISSVP
jgi:uncharacterized protein YkwD